MNLEPTMRQMRELVDETHRQAAIAQDHANSALRDQRFAQRLAKLVSERNGKGRHRRKRGA